MVADGVTIRQVICERRERGREGGRGEKREEGRETNEREGGENERGHIMYHNAPSA